ncbi:hypothetical protein V12B01_13065 [Vibrio splendidus 12B01]|nr:hypothetical protein V12B01_13065 [Vibrio splendidus 12B01]
MSTIQKLICLKCLIIQNKGLQP